MKRNILSLCLLTILPFVKTMAQERCHYTPLDSLFIERLLQSGHTDVLHYARQFMGFPYVAHTLELYPDDERLVLNTQQVDCTTYVDMVVALTLCARRGQTSFPKFVHQLHQQRYWDGHCDGYPSRIHYFSDWIRDNSRLGYVSEVQTGGSGVGHAPFTAVQTVSVGYMTAHPDAYVALARHPELLPVIARQEQDLTGRQYRYIPTSQVQNTALVRQAVHDGDILCIVTTAAGLDIAHLGIAVWHRDGLYMIDASSRHKRVVEEPISMYQYLKHRQGAVGIRVVRLALFQDGQS